MDKVVSILRSESQLRMIAHFCKLFRFYKMNLSHTTSWDFRIFNIYTTSDFEIIDKLVVTLSLEDWKSVLKQWSSNVLYVESFTNLAILCHHCFSIRWTTDSTRNGLHFFVVRTIWYPSEHYRTFSGGWRLSWRRTSSLIPSMRVFHVIRSSLVTSGKMRSTTTTKMRWTTSTIRMSVSGDCRSFVSFVDWLDTPRRVWLNWPFLVLHGNTKSNS